MFKKKISKIVLLCSLVFMAGFAPVFAQQQPAKKDNTIKRDSLGTLKYPFKDEGEFDYPDQVDAGPLYLKQPSNIDYKVEYDPKTKQYILYERVGSAYYRMPKTMSLEEYVQWDFDQSIKSYWKSRQEVESMQDRKASDGLIPDIHINSEMFNSFFGSNTISIKPAGYVEVEFGLQTTYTDNPDVPERIRRVTTFDFDQQVNMSVSGKIGDKVDMKVDYNTESTFEFENQINLNYNGKEDEILQKIEAGNVSLPLNGTLIQGGTNLFGVKTEMQFGKLNLTTVISQNEGESQTVETSGGAQRTDFEIKASEYDENRHFFLSQYFRDNYEKALRSLPTVISSTTINKVEIWVTNKNKNYSSSRDIIAFVDLGEQAKHVSNSVPEFAGTTGNPYPKNQIPFNKANGLYTTLTENYPGIRSSDKINNALLPFETYGFTGGKDWEKIEQARKLETSEYTINTQLGYISLNSPLNNDEVLAVAFDYTINGERYQVGEFSSDGIDAPQTLILKLLKGTTLSPGMKTWDLMMKNIYNLGAYDLSSSDFQLNVVYRNDSTGSYINYLPEGNLKGHILLGVMHLDNLDQQLDPGKPDGMFDFVNGITVLPSSGRIVFPVLEPFGKLLRDSITNQQLAEKYVYQSLYDSTKTLAEQDLEHNKFYLTGSYKGGSGSEIALNAFNLAAGSVKVVASGQQLTENVDYTVDYALGRVKIINESLLEAGTPISVTTESQSLISMQRKTLIGSYASYELSPKMNLGGTFMWMKERPITTKVDLGEEPVSNLMLGLDFQYRDKSKFLTDLVNYIPFYKSKTESSFSLESEAAKLFSMKSSTGNTVYIDDFEGAESSYAYNVESSWYLASIPQGQPNLFPESAVTDSLISGYNRARLSWYSIDPIFFYVKEQTMPSHIKADVAMRSNHYMREVLVKEIYPGKQIAAGSVTRLTTLDLSYFPSERGPFNYDTNPFSTISAGTNHDGTLARPETRWGGMMRQVQTTNFESANIEYIEFWMLDPFIYDQGTHKGGDLYFNLGNISEDILRDSRKGFENGLPTSPIISNVDSTNWGRIPTTQLINQTFDSDPNSRQYQDVGLDGMGNEDETSFFQKYLQKLQGIVDADTYNKAASDPSSDNFMYFRGTLQDEKELSVIDRYRYFNNTEGNSLTTNASSTTKPDVEDINGDNTLNETEAYYQYRVSMRKQDLKVGENYIVEKATRSVKLANDTYEDVDWYHFKIPIRKPDQTIGSISDFKSIRFMRMFLTNFSDSVTLRFATLNLVRSDWRKYESVLSEDDAAIDPNTTLDMTSIDIEESNSRKPINYILPPNIEREVDPSNPSYIETNEQAMLLKVKDLGPGDARGVYKTLGVDMRQYKSLIMDVHAEAIDGYDLADEDLTLFVRMGSDFIYNYYEYEIPLKLTPVPATPYDSDNESDRYIVWPEENRLNINLTLFSKLKETRNALVRKAGSTVKTSDEYVEYDTNYLEGKNKIKIKGSPNIGDVEMVMIGIRNPKDKNLTSKAIEVWVNELRMADTEIKGGWASNTRMSVRLADLGSLSLSGRTQSVGWGSITQSTSERSLEDRYQIDFSANAELGKLFPEKMGLKVPLYYSYSRDISNPEYSPLDPDIKMKDALSTLESDEERREYKALSQDFSERKSFNITNVTIAPERKNPDRKALPFDIENFTVSYARNTENNHDVDTEYDIERNTKGVFNYNYMMQSKYIEPLKNVKLLNKSYLQLLRELNIAILPEMISFRTDMTRNYNERLTRNNTSDEFIMPVIVQKEMLWNRYFDFRFNPTRNLRFDFSNSNILRIDEMEGAMNPNNTEQYKMMRQALYDSIMNLGRPVDYKHNINISYTVPINKLPLLKWTSANITYRGTYNWEAGARMDSIVLGNSLQNSMNLSGSASMNLLTLYNKVPYLKKINDKYQSTSRSYGSRARQQQQQNSKQNAGEAAPKKTKDVKFTDKKIEMKAGVAKSIFHGLGTQDISICVISSKGDTIKGTTSIVNENRANFTSPTDLKNATVYVKGKRTIDQSALQKSAELATRFLMGIRTIRGTYSMNGGTFIPGFMPEPYLFGGTKYQPNANWYGNRPSSIAPTLPYLLGWYDADYGRKFAERGWLTKDSTLNESYIHNLSNSYGINVNIEPIQNLRIDLTGTWQKASNNNSFIKMDDHNNVLIQSPSATGNFSMSIMTIKTAFSDKIGGDSTAVKSAVFNQFLANRSTIAQRLNNQRGGYSEGVGYNNAPDGTSDKDGYGLTSTDVLIPAFLSAYTGIDANEISLSPFPSIKWVRPNWRLTYNGNPQQISWMKNYITSLNISHSYRSTYTVGQFTQNLDYNEYADGFSWVRGELNDNFIPKFDISSVSIQENFSPLINVDVTFTNSLSARVDLKKVRTLNLSFANNQLTEIFRNEFSVGVGYRFSGLDMILKTKKNSEKVSNDLNLMFDITRNNNRTTLRKIVENVNDVQTGSRDYTLSFSADYLMSDKLTLRIFYDRTVADPLVNLYYRSTDNFGVSFKFSLIP